MYCFTGYCLRHSDSSYFLTRQERSFLLTLGTSEWTKSHSNISLFKDMKTRVGLFIWFRSLREGIDCIRANTSAVPSFTPHRRKSLVITVTKYYFTILPLTDRALKNACLWRCTRMSSSTFFLKRDVRYEFYLMTPLVMPYITFIIWIIRIIMKWLYLFL